MLKEYCNFLLFHNIFLGQSIKAKNNYKHEQKNILLKRRKADFPNECAIYGFNDALNASKQYFHIALPALHCGIMRLFSFKCRKCQFQLSNYSTLLIQMNLAVLGFNNNRCNLFSANLT